VHGLVIIETDHIDARFKHETFFCIKGNKNNQLWQEILYTTGSYQQLRE